MVYVGNEQRPQAITAKQRRIDKLKDYPVSTLIVWKFGNGNPLEVLKHDKFGHLITREGNYNPLEVDKYVEK